MSSVLRASHSPAQIDTSPETAEDLKLMTDVSPVSREQQPKVEMDMESLKSDDAMAAVMVTGILSLAFVTLVILMTCVCWWTYASV